MQPQAARIALALVSAALLLLLMLIAFVLHCRNNAAKKAKFKELSQNEPQDLEENELASFSGTGMRLDDSQSDDEEVYDYNGRGVRSRRHQRSYD